VLVTEGEKEDPTRGVLPRRVRVGRKVSENRSSVIGNRELRLGTMNKAKKRDRKQGDEDRGGKQEKRIRR